MEGGHSSAGVSGWFGTCHKWIRDYILDKEQNGQYNGKDIASGKKVRIQKLKRRLNKHYFRELRLLEESLSLEEGESKEVLEFIVNNRWWKAVKEMKEDVKRGASKVKGTI